MKLKRIVIFGFKSFADKTVVTFDGDLTAVVGPNGCGKSNIVDAILWGLGESNARHIRAKVGEDVVFAGAASRKRLGYCEVELLFDNEDGTLPLDAPEVSIARKMTRSGESRYRINGRNCRLRDVNELLADSGLGRAGYAIVSQSEIDQALAASPDQRRQWVDEAAGIQRYRAHRDEAMSRLGHAQGHLKRVDDIIEELASQRGPLQKEAEAARSHKSVMEALATLESLHLAHQLSDSMDALAATHERIEATNDRIEVEGRAMASLEIEARSLESRLLEREREAEAARERRESLRATNAELTTQREVAISRLGGLEDLQNNLEQTRQEGAESERLAREELGGATEHLEAERAKLVEMERQSGDEGPRLTELATDLAALDRRIAEAQDGERERSLALAQIQMRTDRLRLVLEQRAGVERALPDLEEALAEAEAAESKAQAELAAAKERAERIEGSLAKERGACESLAERQRKGLRELAEMEGRRASIEHALQTHEGLGQGAKAVLDAAESGTLKGEFTPIADAIRAQEEHTAALEAALGGMAGLLISNSLKACEGAIEHLQAGDLGRAAFLPTDDFSHIQLPNLTDEQGFVAMASELVAFDGDHKEAMRELLGRIAVFQGLDQAIKAARRHGVDCVTLSGEQVSSCGVVTGGRAGMSGPINRRAALAALNDAIAALTSQLKAIAGELELHEGALADATKARDAEQASIAALATQRHEATDWMLGIKQELAGATRALDALISEQTDLEAVQDAPAQSAADLSDLGQKRDELMQELAARRAKAEESDSRLWDARRRVELAAERCKSTGARLNAATSGVQERAKRSETIGPEREALKTRLGELETSIQAGGQEIERADAALTLAIQSRRELAESRDAANARLGSSRSAIEKAREELARQEIKQAGADARRAGFAERLIEQYAIDADSARALATQNELPEDAAETVAALKRRLKAMGEVNLGALEAHERLNGRCAELEAQRSDVLEGIRAIETGIRELDAVTEERFMEAFERLQLAFTDAFGKIFDGGQGEIYLEKGESVLDAGVQIAVTVPGKKRQRLELLSGGERALSACAFLFALLKVRPSPLVILDEVDAPLDGRNVERYVELLREFTAASQFVLVTHNPVTIESCDTWLGVVMQEPGVSTLIPYKAPCLELAEGKANGNGSEHSQGAGAYLAK